MRRQMLPSEMGLQVHNLDFNSRSLISARLECLHRPNCLRLDVFTLTFNFLSCENLNPSRDNLVFQKGFQEMFTTMAMIGGPQRGPWRGQTCHAAQCVQCGNWVICTVHNAAQCAQCCTVHTAQCWLLGAQCAHCTTVHNVVAG